jgi:hypothetical protein
MLAFGFTACEKDGPAEGAIWDFSPINFYFTLTGENGEDLLNPATPGSYAGLNITATYEDKTYEKDVFEDNKVPYSRAYFAHLFGIYTTQLQDGRYALCFGELDGADTYKDATLTLQWGDGTTDVITFSSKLKWKGHDPVINRSFKLNGTEVAKDTPRPHIDIKKTAFDYSPVMEWDVTPLTFSIFLRNKNGYDLLNSFVDNYVYQDSVKAIFQGKEYYLNKKLENRVILPEFTGLTRPWHDQNDTRAYPIYFGELDGTETFENEMLIMDWNTLGRDTITFTSKMEWKNGKPTFIRSYSLNGEEVDKDTARPIIHIMKDVE